MTVLLSRIVSPGCFRIARLCGLATLYERYETSPTVFTFDFFSPPNLHSTLRDSRWVNSFLWHSSITQSRHRLRWPQVDNVERLQNVPLNVYRIVSPEVNRIVYPSDRSQTVEINVSSVFVIFINVSINIVLLWNNNNML